MSKYDPLHTFLQNAPLHLEELILSFVQIKQILGSSLPASAYQYQAWWSNPSTLMLKAGSRLAGALLALISGKPGYAFNA